MLEPLVSLHALADEPNGEAALFTRSASNPGWHRGYRRAVQVPPRTRVIMVLTSHFMDRRSRSRR